MTNAYRFQRSPSAKGKGARLFRATLATLALTGIACSPDEILEVEDPDVATPESVTQPSALPVVRSGAVRDLQLAYSGSGEDSWITLTGLFSDELVWAESFPTRLEVDTRNIQQVNGTMTPMLRNIQRARAASERAAEAFARLQPDNPWYGEVLNMAGYSYIFMAEAYCSGIPMSTLSSSGATEYGPALTTAQVFELAVARFDSALKVLGTGGGVKADTQRFLASVGKGRALLNLNRPADAKTAVAGVPTGFAYRMLHSENTGQQNNSAFIGITNNRRFTPAEAREGVNGLPYRTEGDVNAGGTDPRIKMARGGSAQASNTTANGIDSSTPLFAPFEKYPNRSASAVLGDGVEARLIEAEADLRAGNAAWLTTINALRTSRSMGPVSDAGSQAANVDLLFKERAYFLWLTAHRMGDLRRLIRQYQRQPESVFPTGGYFKGGSYGPDVNWPIPFDEFNNPNFQGCIDRNA
jgi:hypothetical protein